MRKYSVHIGVNNLNTVIDISIKYAYYTCIYMINPCTVEGPRNFDIDKDIYLYTWNEFR